MAIRITDLSPAMARQALEKLRLQEQREQSRSGSKYHNVKEQRGGITFDSKKEAGRYDELMTLLATGVISDLRLQHQFTLQEAYTTPEGQRIRAIRYTADFSYRDQNGAFVVEDVKSQGTRTRDYIMRRKMMQERHGITVREV